MNQGVFLSQCFFQILSSLFPQEIFDFEKLKRNKFDEFLFFKKILLKKISQEKSH